MSYSLQDTSDLTALGNAIRAKNGSSDNYTVAQMATAVSNISTGSGGSSPAAEFAIATIQKSSDLQNYTSVPSGVFVNNYIPNSLFFNNPKVRLTSLPSNIINIGDSSFESSSVALTSLPPLSNIGASAFQNCWSLTIAAVTPYDSNGVQVSGNAFRGCTGLTNLYLKKFLCKGSTIFENCSNLQTVTIEEGYFQYNNTFRNCSSLTTVYLIGSNNLKANLFDVTHCPNLTDIYVDSSQGTIANAPWGATNATIHYDWVPPTT